MKRFRLTALAATAVVIMSAGLAGAQTTLRIGLAEDPDILDPTLARTYVGRIVFAAFCDKLFDIDEKLNVVPQLALGYDTAPDGCAFHTRCPFAIARCHTERPGGCSALGISPRSTIRSRLAPGSGTGIADRSARL